MKRIARSWRLMKQSYRVLMQDKELLLLPVISGGCILLAMASFVVPLWATDSPERSDAFWLAMTFLFYVVTYTISIFFQAAIVAGATERMRGGDPTLGSALSAAGSRFGAILCWGIVAGTVGMILRAIQERSEWVGKLVAGLLGAAWSLATFFVVPVIVMEKKSVRGSFGRSWEMIRGAWGEAVAGNVGLGFAAFLASLPFLGLAGVFGYYDLAIAAATVVILGVLTLGVFFAAMQGVYVAAVYHYATTRSEPGGFNIGDLEETFK